VDSVEPDDRENTWTTSSQFQSMHTNGRWYLHRTQRNAYEESFFLACRDLKSSYERDGEQEDGNILGNADTSVRVPNQ
jgi:hypothetical protein